MGEFFFAEGQNVLNRRFLYICRYFDCGDCWCRHFWLWLLELNSRPLDMEDEDFFKSVIAKSVDFRLEIRDFTFDYQSSQLPQPLQTMLKNFAFPSVSELRSRGLGNLENLGTLGNMRN